jgi:NADPH2:quinone reductase
MNAVILKEFGPAANLEPAELPRPEPLPGCVLVRLHAASVNPVDTKIRSLGPPIAPELPGVLGCDFAGVVEAMGEGASRFAHGDEVIGCAGGVQGMEGAYAEYMNADERLLAPKPQTLDMRQAAALPLVSITAWEAVMERLAVMPGEDVLVHGGTGGVGHMGVQLARVAGARVSTTVSTPEKAALARELGAHEVVNYREESVADYVERLTDSRGFDAVFDATGGQQLPTDFEAACSNGDVAALVSLFECDLSLMHMKGLSLHLVFMLLPMLENRGRERHGEILRRVGNLVDAGRIAPLLVDRRFRLEEAAAAHEFLESGQAVGKIVLDIAD